MRVPLTVLDFIERAEFVYGDRIGIIDEPDQPAALGELTWAEFARTSTGKLQKFRIRAPYWAGRARQVN